jgi:hypothetical protein
VGFSPPHPEIGPAKGNANRYKNFGSVRAAARNGFAGAWRDVNSPGNPSQGAGDIVLCDACPVLCRIRAGKTGACDRYGNIDGRLTRMDPLVALAGPGGPVLTAIGAGTTYPDYKPAPFIVGSTIDGVDMVTVVSEGVFSYCGLKIKIDTDRHLGSECAPVRVRGEPVGHVSTAEYGSQFLAVGGVNHLTGGSKRAGVVTCETMLTLANRGAVELSVEGGATVVVQAGAAPVVDAVAETRMRVGCGSATTGIFAQQWRDHADEVIVVDDHITGVLTEHQAGRFLGMRPAGIRVRGRRSTPGRYFQVANPGQGWGGTDITDPLSIIERIDPHAAWPGLRLLMVSTTGEHAAWFVLDDALRPVAADPPPEIAAAIALIGENCEPALCTVLFMAGAGGSLRAGATGNPVRLTRSVQAGRTRVTAGGAPVYLWPGGGITFMVDVAAMPANSFGSVPTPALVAPIEFTTTRAEFAALGGHVDAIRPLAEVLAEAAPRLRLLPA